MSLHAAAILGALRAVIEGRQGAVRVVEPGRFALRRGIATMESAQLLELNLAPAEGDQLAHLYDIRILRDADHPATPISNLSDRRFVLLVLAVDVVSFGKRMVDDDDCQVGEMEFEAAVREDLHAARKAFTWGGNLTTREDTGEPTTLMDGQLFGPNGTGEPVINAAVATVDGCMFARARIDCAAVIEELQEVA